MDLQRPKRTVLEVLKINPHLCLPGSSIRYDTEQVLAFILEQRLCVTYMNDSQIYLYQWND